MSRSTCHQWCGLAIVCAFALAPGALAAGRPMGNEADTYVKAMDTNGDGKLSPDEHAADAKKMVEKMDTDADGFVSKTELAAGHAKMLKKRTELNR